MAESGTLYEGIISISVQDNDAPGQVAAIIDRLEAQMGKIAGLPGVDLGEKLTGSLGKGVQSAETGIAKISMMIEGLSRESERLNQINAGGGGTADSNRMAQQIRETTVAAKALIEVMERLGVVENRALRSDGLTHIPLTASQQFNRLPEEERQARLSAEEQARAAARANPIGAAAQRRSASTETGLLDPNPDEREMSRREQIQQASRARTKAALEEQSLRHAQDKATLESRILATNETDAAKAKALVTMKLAANEETARAAVKQAKIASGEEKEKFSPDVAGFQARLEEQKRAEASLLDRLRANLSVSSSQVATLENPETSKKFPSQTAADEAYDRAKARRESDQLALNKELDRQAAVKPDLGGMDDTAATSVQRRQYEVAVNEAKLATLRNAEAGSATEAQVADAELKVKESNDRLALAKKKQAEAAEKALASQGAAAAKVEADLSGLDPDASPRIQTLQIDKAIAEAKVKELSAAQKGAVTQVEIAQAKLKARRLEEQLLIEQAKELAQVDNEKKPRGFFTGLTQGYGASRGGGGGFGGGLGLGGGGFGSGLAEEAGFALKYYALYQVFAAGTAIMAGIKTATEEYTLAVNDLSIALGKNYEEASHVASGYANIGSTLATNPTVAVTGGTKFARTFRNEDGSADPSAGTLGATVTSLVNVLEGPTKLDETVQSLIAVTKAYGGGAASAQGLYDQATQIGQYYGFATGGEVLGGAAQIADIGSAAGYDPQQLLALIGGGMQATGLTGDAVAGDIKRFLGADMTGLKASLGALGIDTQQALGGMMQDLSTKLQSMPKEQADALLQGLGGSRSSATVIGAVLGIPDANQAAKISTSFPTAADQAQKKLDTLAGALQRLGTDAQTLFVALANSGLGDLAGLGIEGLHNTLQAIITLVEGFNQLPGPMKELIALVVALTGAAKVAATIKGSAGILGLAGDIGAAATLRRAERSAAGGAFGSFAAETLGSTAGEVAARRGMSLPRAAASGVASSIAESRVGQAVTGAGAAVAASRLAGVASSLGGVATVAGAALRVLGPLGLAIGAIVAIGEAADQKRKDQAHGDAADLALRNPAAAGDQNAQAARLSQLKAARADVGRDVSGSGWMGDSLTALHEGLWDNSFKIGNYLPGNDRAKRKTELDHAIAEAQAQMVAIQREKELSLAGQRPNQDFGKNFTDIGGGVDLIKSRGLGAGEATGKLETLVKGIKESTDPTLLTRALQPLEGHGITDLVQYISQRIGEMNDPTARQSALADLRAKLQSLMSQAAGRGDAGQVDAVKQLLETTNKQMDDQLVSNTIAKINSLKALNPKGDKSTVAKINALAKGALTAVLQNGDIDSAVQIIDGLDKSILAQFRKNLQSAIAILRKQADDLRKMIAEANQMAAAVFAVTPGGDELMHGNGKSANGVDAYDNKLAPLDKQIAAQQKMLKNLDTATSLSAPSGDFTEWPKEPKAKKETYPEDDIAMAKIQAQAIAGDPVSQATAALRVAQYQLAHYHGDKAKYWQAVKAVNDGQYALAQAQKDSSISAVLAGAISGDPLSEARANLRAAQITLANAGGTAAYYQALKGLHDSQYALAQAEQEKANNAALLNIDMTDPVAQAQAKVDAARRKLNADRARGADTTADRVALRQAQNDANSSAWNQEFQDQQTNYSLQRTSLTAYQSYLQAQHNYLTAVKHKTRAQVDELNQVDQALKSLTDSMDGQFNLGQIKVPTPYEVRRSMGGGSPTASTQTVTINVNGNDLNAMRSVIGEYLGQGVMQTTGTSTRKV